MNQSKFPSLAGFSNRSRKTCYANSALKVLIHTLGTARLQSHLMEFAKNPGQQKSSAHVAAAKSFIQLINKAQSSQLPVHTELEDFLTRLQSLEEFSGNDANGNYLFDIFNKQQDADHFLRNVSNLFDLHLIPGGVSTTTSTLTNGQESRNQATIPESIRELLLKSDGMLLQELMGTINFSEPVDVRWRPLDNTNTQVVKSVQMAVEDIQQFDRLAIHISSRDKRYALPIDIDQAVKLAVFDQKTLTHKMVTLEARAVCAHRGEDAAGHYVAYLKSNDKKWSRHNDSTIRHDAVLEPGEFPKLIVFAVTKVEDAQ